MQTSRTTTTTTITSSPFFLHPLPSPPLAPPPPPPMAERLPPPPPPPGRPPPSPPNGDDDDDNLPFPPGTAYVVQVPKDQIYRVPPPENALLAEKYRKDLHQRRKRRPCIATFGWILAALLVLAVVLLLAGIILYLVFRPTTPSFSFDRVSFTPSHPAGRHSTTNSRYDLILKARNPSARTGFYSEPGAGTASLSIKGSDVADGKTPEFLIAPGKLGTIKLALHGKKKKDLPKDVVMGLKGKTKASVRMSVSIDAPVKLKVVGMTIWSMKMAVKCNVRVGWSNKKAHVVSQQCDAEFR